MEEDSEASFNKRWSIDGTSWANSTDKVIALDTEEGTDSELDEPSDSMQESKTLDKTVLIYVPEVKPRRLADWDRSSLSYKQWHIKGMRI